VSRKLDARLEPELGLAVAGYDVNVYSTPLARRKNR
jgi:hypothetical protein